VQNNSSQNSGSIPDRINISDYIYELPDEKIAKFPLEKRDSSKLLVYRDGEISSRIFSDLPFMVSGDEQLVFNNTRVIQARLSFKKASGAVIEVFLLEPVKPEEYQLSFSSLSGCTWKCLIGNSKKWKNGVLEKIVIRGDKEFCLKAERSGENNEVRFQWDIPELSFSEIILLAGQTPIPPYLERDAEESDLTQYQTVYSSREGSVAAPTAGLHFTDELLKRLEDQGTDLTYLTLHVGAGTFVPVKTENALKHPMHTEHIYLQRKSLEGLKKPGKQIIAVGTTSVRTLETIFHIAEKIKRGGQSGMHLNLEQWEAYGNSEIKNRKEAISVLTEFMDQHRTDILKISTRIMIVPGYRFRMTDRMITNFHQPGSTLLLLIAAFTCGDWKRIYDYALQNEYRFLSYGDSSIIYGKEESD
jgi:S-adenosylmethionine:tRNA ribosyltransferase-isomerase